MVRRPGRARLRDQFALVASAARRVEPLPRAAMAAIAAFALLTTFATTSPADSPTAFASAPGAPELDGATVGSTEVARSPEVDGLLAADLDDGADERPTIPVVGGERELSAFEHSPVGDVAAGETVTADLVVRADDGAVDPETLADPLAGAQHAAAGAGLTATTSTPAGEEREVTLLGVDGATFRPLTPAITAGADAVWERLDDGDALVSHELAEELELELGGELVLTTDTATVPVRVGAFAANGAPPIAEVIVPVEVAADLGADEGPNTLIVAAGKGDAETLGDALAEATGGEVELRRAPVAPTASGGSAEDAATGRAQMPARRAASGRIEPFTYTSRADGRITIHGDWVARNIVRVQLPGMPATSCHEAMVPQLTAVVEELIDRDLYSHLDPSQFAGCFVARHIDWNPNRPLSMHAWGLAIDFNTQDNWLGADPKMDRRVVEVFERWGFDWGGHWRRPDGMHFELARIVPVP